MSESVKPARFETSIQARLLYEKLATIGEGGTVSYAALSETIGADIQVHWHFLTRARRWMLKRKRIVFDVIRDEGLKRVDNSGLLGVMDRYRRHVGATARRGVEVAHCGEYEKFTPDEQRHYNTDLATFGLLRALSSTRAHDWLVRASPEPVQFKASDALQRLRAGGVLK